MKKRNFLENLEYVALAAFVIGVIFAVYWQQVIWAAAPLVLLISLNIYNRYQLEKLTQQSLTNISSIKKTLDQEFSELRTSVEKLTQLTSSPQSNPDVQNLVWAMQNLQPQINSLEESTAPMKFQLDAISHQVTKLPEAQHLEHLRETLIELSESVADLQRRLPQSTLPALLPSRENLNHPSAEPHLETTHLISADDQPGTSHSQPLTSSLANSENPNLAPPHANPESSHFELADHPSAPIEVQPPDSVLARGSLNHASAESPSNTENSTPEESQPQTIDDQSLEAPLLRSLNPNHASAESQPETGNSSSESSQPVAIEGEQFLSRYAEGERDFIGVNLAGANLNNACLEGVNLKYSNLSRVQLRGAILDSANLQATDIMAADLRGANLANADLTGANLTEADLRSTNLCDAYLRGANLADADLSGANLCNASLWGANLRGARLHASDMVRAELKGAIMPDGIRHE